MRRLALVLVTLGLAVAACGGTAEPGSEASTTQVPPTSAVPGTTTSETPAPTTTTATPTTTVPDEPLALGVYLYLDEPGQPHRPGPFLAPVHREVPNTVDTAAAALGALLAGPTADEAASVPGLSTAIPEGTELLGVSMEGGLATVDLSAELSRRRRLGSDGDGRRPGGVHRDPPRGCHRGGHRAGGRAGGRAHQPGRPGRPAGDPRRLHRLPGDGLGGEPHLRWHRHQPDDGDRRGGCLRGHLRVRPHRQRGPDHRRGLCHDRRGNGLGRLRLHHRLRHRHAAARPPDRVDHVGRGWQPGEHPRVPGRSASPSSTRPSPPRFPLPGRRRAGTERLLARYRAAP